MIIRLVKMTFKPEHGEEFKAFSTTIHHTIRSFEGCEFLEIIQDINHPEIFFSHSHWQSEDNLNYYRNSAFFKSTWTKTKQWFGAKPEAWSTKKI